MTPTDIERVREECQGEAGRLFNEPCPHNDPGDLLPRLFAADCARCVTKALTEQRAAGMEDAACLIDSNDGWYSSTDAEKVSNLLKQLRESAAALRGEEKDK